MSGTKNARAATARIENVIPILRVRSLEASITYYSTVLGFDVDWHIAGSIASVSRDGHAVMLCQGDQGNLGTWVWIGVDGASLFDELVERGATIRMAPTNYSWAYEMRVDDPDGHILRFGAEPRRDLPFED